MSVEQLPDSIHIKTFDNGEEVECGAFQVNESGNLRAIISRLFIKAHASLGGSETLTMKLYPNNLYDSDTVLATSTAFSLSDLTFSGGNADYIGDLAFEFSDFNLNSSITYYAGITVASYTRNADTFYLGMVYDHPQPLHNKTNFYWSAQPIKMSVLTEVVRSI